MFPLLSCHSAVLVMKSMRSIPEGVGFSVYRHDQISHEIMAALLMNVAPKKAANLFFLRASYWHSVIWLLIHTLLYLSGNRSESK